MTDEEAMEELITAMDIHFRHGRKIGLPTGWMQLAMSLIASDKGPIPDDVTIISEHLHMDGAVVESSVKELLVRQARFQEGFTSYS